MTNSDVVTKMLDSWKLKDVEAVASFFTEDAIYTNVPIAPPNRGIAEIKTFLTWFFGEIRSLEFITHRQVEGADGTVMNERIDKLDFTGDVVELPVMGVFELRDGKICTWRDYFDMALLDALNTDVSVPR